MNINLNPAYRLVVGDGWMNYRFTVDADELLRDVKEVAVEGLLLHLKGKRKVVYSPNNGTE